MWNKTGKQYNSMLVLEMKNN